MGKRRDEDGEPTLELPSFFRRKRRGPVEDEAPPEAEAEPAPEPEPEPEPTVSLPAEPVAADPEPVAAPPPAPSNGRSPRKPDAPTDAPEAVPAAQPDSAPAPEPARRRAARPRRSAPSLSPGAASLLVGVVVGAVGTALTWAALQGCEALRGTDSCGGPGLLVLVAILVLMVLAGGLLLKALRVSEPNATSFLGVGLMTVTVLVTLMESLFSAWMFLAVPVLTALSYLAAQWVSTRFVDTEEPSPGVDIR